MSESKGRIVEVIEEETQLASVESKLPLVYPSTAFSIAKSIDGEWKVVSIGFNLETGETGDLKVLRGDGDKYVAVEGFKIAVSESPIMNND